MGQVSSRSRPSPRRPSTISHSSPPSGTGSDVSPNNASRSSSPARPRSSLNRAIRHLLSRPRATLAPSSSPHTTPSVRKRWRSSRRFSKQPSPLPALSETNVDDYSHAPSLDSPFDPPVSLPDTSCCPDLTLGPSTQPSSLSPPLLPPTSLTSDSSPLQDPLPPRAHLVLADSDPHHTELPPQASCRHSQLSQPSSQVDEDCADFLSTHTTDKTFVQGSSQDGQGPTPSPQSLDSPPYETPPELTSDSQSQPSRHFQGPGPLVVVQGVVNTSDNPPAQTEATSRPPRPSSLGHSFIPPISRRHSISSPRNDSQSEERQTARSRLSALIPRPSSMLGRRSSTPDRASVPSQESSSNDPSHLSRDTSSEPPTSQGGFSTSEQDLRSSSESDARPRPLSPGSIDVLGTLLSVAAAATAASLFSPGLGFQANVDSNSPPLSGIPRPMSPTPTAGLGGGEAFSNLPEFGLDPSTPASQSPTTVVNHREGRERVRNVWESFRERLGLRNPSASRISDDTPSGAGGQSNMRPGEIMLAEMARALNIGLGLNASDPNAENPEHTAGLTGNEGIEEVGSQRPLPPEDSFERFLLNLQADLRTALSDDGGGASSMTPAGDDSEGRASHDSDEGEASHPPLFDELPVGAVEAEEDDDEPASLEDVSGSDEEEEEDEYPGQASTRTATPMPSANSLPSGRVERSSLGAASGDENGDADRGQPGINLWRLYRFQPIPANQVAGHASATTLPTPPLSPTSSSSSFTPSAPTAPQLPSQAGSLSSPLSPVTPDPDGAGTLPTVSTFAQDDGSHMVVPVIVVGLQSVNMGQVQGHGNVHPDSQIGQPNLRESDRRSASFDSTGTAIPVDGLGTTTPRGRSWQSRAATALRNLRPGRRNGPSTQPAVDGAGSRTFLIYVIGGYYPPNHHMVTGSDNLDSYEALWELAELLGQVKPPVATREDIDRSGLQIIKTTELEQYEQQGKLASNCVERCLICLDNYSSDEDLRLMTCKHAFHKDCVDKWLQVGRNNCPACRTKGVSTTGDAMH